MPGIYQILNKISGKFYIGSATNFSRRWTFHTWELKNRKHKNTHLQRAWDKYGAKAFEFQILEITDNLTIREQFWLDWTNATVNGYNIRKDANSPLGCSPSIETRAKISASQIGKEMSDEAKLKMSAAKAGLKFSDDTKIKMSKAQRKLDKWPHTDGCRCRCQECNFKRNDLYQAKYRLKKFG